MTVFHDAVKVVERPLLECEPKWAVICTREVVK